jgi:DNA mismatch repair protein MutS2
MSLVAEPAFLIRKTLDLLEWPILFQHVLNECLTPYGLADWEVSPFLPDEDAIAVHVQEVEGLKTLLQRYGDVTLEAAWPDMRPTVRRLLKEGLLSLTELRQLLRTLREGGTMLRHFAKMLKSEAALNYLGGLLDEGQIPNEALTYLLKYFQPNGELRDDASPRLAELRRTLIQRQQNQQRQIQAILQRPEILQALQSPTVTERDGRLVVPVKVEFKSRLPGVIHGASASGATLFVEPEALVQLNSELQSLQAALQQEIERIIALVSIGLHPFAEAFQNFLTALARLDRRLAAARLSRKLDANPVAVVHEERLVDVRRARHPLLLLNRLQQRGTIVPNDLRLGGRLADGSGESERLLLITGPNTGGKTVLLKTIGLFACMLRAGLHLPVAEGSRMSLFEPVLAVLGDQQDLTQDLSTFSAHVQQLMHLVAEETDLSRALVLIDEIAAGTDPVEGAALAKAVLDEIHRKGALAIVTTHLGELKTEAHQHPGFMNASMAFDPDTLSPSYRLLLGIPGASNALTIAERLGLKQSVITKARQSLGKPLRESADLLQELETKNQQLQLELESARSYRLEAQNAWERLEADRQRFETERRQSLKQFQTGLKGRIHELEERLKRWRKDLTLAEIGQADASFDPEQLKSQLQRAGQRADTIFSQTREAMQEAPGLAWDDLKVGMTVNSRQLELSGEIISLKPQSQEVVLQSGPIRMTLPLADLEVPHRQRGSRSGQKLVKGTSVHIRQPRRLDRPARVKEDVRDTRSFPAEPGRPPENPEDAADPSMVCDVRGQRAQEAIETVEKFLDEAILAGDSAVAVVHGLGTGALKREIRQVLAKSTYVRRYYPAQAVRGGDGKTIIELGPL